ncbi:MAG: hypothetical protein ACI3Z9_01970 [Candidatus Onthomorpha sp.]
MHNGILKMIAPQLLKSASDPKVKEKLLKLLNDKKAEYLSEAEENAPYTDVRLMLSSTQNDIIIKIVLYDFESKSVTGVLSYYRYEQLLEEIKKLM